MNAIQDSANGIAPDNVKTFASEEARMTFLQLYSNLVS